MKVEVASGAVSPDELLAQLHTAVTGKEGEKSSTVSEYELLNPQEGMEKTKKYYSMGSESPRFQSWDECA